MRLDPRRFRADIRRKSPPRSFVNKVFFLAILFSMALPVLPAAAEGGPYETVDELWEGFDPKSEPLDVEVAEEWKEDGLVFRTVIYTAETAGGQRARIAAFFGFPAGKEHLPAVVHIHGGGQTASLSYVKYWARLGYAALSINWGGRAVKGQQVEVKTDWAGFRVNQNNADSASVYGFQPDARSNSWYHWTIACRRGITLLEQTKEVDPSRIGIFGISMGGQIVWLVAGTDKRVKAAVSVYGAVLQHAPVPGVPDSEYAPEAAKVPEWEKTIDPIAYAPGITCPFFYLSGANDFYGRIDLVDKALRAIPDQSRVWQSYTPHYSHHVGDEQAAALPMWMECWLKNGPKWPVSPRLNPPANDGRGASMTLAADQAGAIRRVTFYGSTGKNPGPRFWRTIPGTKDAESWRVDSPANQGEFFFANVLYKSGLSLSTPLLHLAPGEPGPEKAPAGDLASVLISDFSKDTGDWFFPDASVDFLLGAEPVWSIQPGSPASARPGDNPAWSVATRKIGDPMWRGSAEAALEIRLKSSQPNTLAVTVTKNMRRPAGKNTKTYVATAQLKGQGWETVLLPMREFREVESGDPLDSWTEADLLSLQGQFRPEDSSRQFGEDWQGPPPDLSLMQWRKN